MEPLWGTIPARAARTRNIRKPAGHRSRELERYEHLSPLLKRQTVELIAKQITDTATDTLDSDGEEESSEVIEKYGGDDGARTRDLRRDRPKAHTKSDEDFVYFQFVARIVKGYFSGCYSTCYSSRPPL